MQRQNTKNIIISYVIKDEPSIAQAIKLSTFLNDLGFKTKFISNFNIQFGMAITEECHKVLSTTTAVVCIGNSAYAKELNNKPTTRLETFNQQLMFVAKSKDKVVPLHFEPCVIDIVREIPAIDFINQSYPQAFNMLLEILEKIHSEKTETHSAGLQYAKIMQSFFSVEEVKDAASSLPTAKEFNTFFQSKCIELVKDEHWINKFEDDGVTEKYFYLELCRNVDPRNFIDFMKEVFDIDKGVRVYRIKKYEHYNYIYIPLSLLPKMKATLTQSMPKLEAKQQNIAENDLISEEAQQIKTALTESLLNVQMNIRKKENEKETIVAKKSINPFFKIENNTKIIFDDGSSIELAKFNPEMKNYLLKFNVNEHSPYYKIHSLINECKMSQDEVEKLESENGLFAIYQCTAITKDHTKVPVVVKNKIYELQYIAKMTQTPLTMTKFGLGDINPPMGFFFESLENTVTHLRYQSKLEKAPAVRAEHNLSNFKK